MLFYFLVVTAVLWSLTAVLSLLLTTVLYFLAADNLCLTASVVASTFANARVSTVKESNHNKHPQKVQSCLEKFHLGSCLGFRRLSSWYTL